MLLLLYSVSLFPSNGNNKSSKYILLAINNTECAVSKFKIANALSKCSRVITQKNIKKRRRSNVVKL